MTSPIGEILIRSIDGARAQRGGVRHPARTFAGFSLIELILVLLLLSLAAGMASPMLGKFARGRSTTDAAGHLLAIMQYAQDQAAMAGGPHRLNVDEKNNTYWLTAAPNGVYNRIASEIGRNFTLPENVTLKLEGSNDLITRGYIQFDPDGGHDMAALRLTDAQGKAIIIGCASPSEPFRIGDPADLKEQGQW